MKTKVKNWIKAQLETMTTDELVSEIDDWDWLRAEGLTEREIDYLYSLV